MSCDPNDLARYQALVHRRGADLTDDDAVVVLLAGAVRHRWEQGVRKPSVRLNGGNYVVAYVSEGSAT